MSDHYFRFTAVADAVIVKMWPTSDVAGIAAHLGCSETGVRGRRRWLVSQGVDLPPHVRGRPKTFVRVPHSICPPQPPTAWPDGWSILPPTRARLMAGR